MKKIAVVFIALFILISAFTVSASSELSPGIAVLRKESSMRKCFLSGSTSYFSLSDFESSLGEKPDAICICSLPDKSLGTLSFNGEPVYRGQIISAGDIDLLSFISAGTGEYTATFGFCNAADSSAEYMCCLNFVCSENQKPVAKELTVNAVEGVEYIGCLCAEDADGDDMTYEIKCGAENGSVNITDEKTGTFRYYPEKAGKDSFSYTVTDEKGNISEETYVGIKTERNKSGVSYGDMSGNAAHTAAIRLAESGVMVGEKIGGVNLFHPDDEISASAFLRICMQLENIDLSGTDVSAFGNEYGASGYDIPYICYAKNAGIIESINPDESISYTEAVGIISKLSGIDEIEFTEASARLTDDASASVTRAGAAILLEKLIK